MNKTLPSEAVLRKSPTNTPCRDLFVKGTWCPEEIRQIISARADRHRQPAHLFLGKREARLLREYLAEHENAAKDIDLQGLQYMGLTIVLLESTSLLRVAGDLYMNHLTRTGRLRDPIDTSTSWWRLNG